MYCSKCGAEVGAGMKFCPYCGVKLPELKSTSNVELSKPVSKADTKHAAKVEPSKLVPKAEPKSTSKIEPVKPVSKVETKIKKNVTPKVSTPPAKRCRSSNEESFFYNNSSSIKGLEAYCKRYPNGFYIDVAREYLSARYENRRRRFKVLRLLVLIVLIPILVLSASLGGARWHHIAKLVKWYEGKYNFFD